MKKNSITVINNSNGESFDFDILNSTIGPDTVDFRQFYKKTNLFTYDPGFMSTASCKSTITYIDGENGILSHRGYDIKHLAENHDYIETCFLLMKGHLPSVDEKKDFIKKVFDNSYIHEQIHTFFKGFRRDAHPMAIIVGAIGALSAFYPEESYITDKESQEMAIIRLIGKIPNIASMAYKYSIGQPFNYPDDKYSFTQNLLHMMFSTPNKRYEPSDTIVNALDKILILHADHEQNASTSTVRVAASSGANPFACIAAGVSSLWGPAHGGANQAVINMLEEIGTPDNIPKYIEMAKEKSNPFRLMGFGHRVYKNYDPRAKVIKSYCYKILEELNMENNKLFQTALELEKAAMQDEYFVERKLFPNVDFYSGIILSAIGFPKEMFTVLFTIGRTIGWSVQWNEMMNDDELKISRPRQLYVGEKLK